MTTARATFAVGSGPADNEQAIVNQPTPRSGWRWFRAARFWLALLALILIGAVLLTVTSDRSSHRPLDPASASADGSQALARLLGRRGTHVERSSDITRTSGDAPVLVTDPTVYSAAQLQGLSSNHRLILIEPDPALLAALAPGLAGSEDDAASLPDGDVAPSCSDEGSVAAGVVHFEDSSIRFGVSECYAGRVLITPRLVALGDYTRLTNESLGDRGVAALDLNLLSDDGQSADLIWLMAELDPAATSTATVWALFPDWAPRAVAWLCALGVLAALWRGRRLAPVVVEPLPVAVRGSEVVRGHARLYRRASAREHAAAALRRASIERLAVGAGLRRPTAPDLLLAALPVAQAEELKELLAGPITGDAELVALARGLSALEAGRTSIDHTPSPTAPRKGPTS